MSNVDMILISSNIVNIFKKCVACVTIIQNEIRSECLVMRIEGASAGASNETDLLVLVRHRSTSPLERSNEVLVKSDI